MLSHIKKITYHKINKWRFLKMEFIIKRENTLREIIALMEELERNGHKPFFSGNGDGSVSINWEA
jgi:hypothetical protein